MDMNSEQQLQHIEISLENAKKAIDLATALQRLHENPDFKTVILDDFFKEEASHSVLLKSDASMSTDEKQKSVDIIITSIGGLYQYFGKVYRLGDMAIKAIAADQSTREEILEEQLSETPVN